MAGPPFIRKVTPIASAASWRVAPASAAAWACEAMQPSHPSTTPIARAMKFLGPDIECAGGERGVMQFAEASVNVWDGPPELAVKRGKLAEHGLP